MARRRKQPNGRLTDYQPQPVSAPTGLEYGEAGKLRSAQNVIPLRQDLAPAPALAQAQAFNPFSGVTPMAAPSSRPDEPVTAGLATGAGPGPAAIPQLLNTAGLALPVADALAALVARDPGLANLANLARSQQV